MARLLGALVLLCTWLISATVTQMHMSPVPWPTLRAALLLASVLYVTARASAWVQARIEARWQRSSWLLRLSRRWAIALGIWMLATPAILLCMTVHRAQGTLPTNQIAQRWPMQEVQLRASDGVVLSALWFPNPRAQGAVLLMHGIGAEKMQFLSVTESLYARGFSVMTLDLRNHGASGGTTCTFGITEARDVAAAWTALLAFTPELAGPRLLFGISMGGAAAQFAAPTLPEVDGLVLDSTFAHMNNVAPRAWPMPWPLSTISLSLAHLYSYALTGMDVLSSSPIDEARANMGSYPVLIIHADEDPLVPYAEGVALARAYGARAELLTLQAACHPNGHLYAPGRYRAALDNLVERAIEVRSREHDASASP